MSTIKTTTLSTQGGSTVPVDTVVNGTAKAWVNFDGTGTVSIRRAFNVSSITDIGVGYYQINLTTALTDTDFSVVPTCSNGSWYSNSAEPLSSYAVTTTSARIYCWTRGVSATGSSTGGDMPMVCVSIFS
tara:strand:+ start:340 stop:729 length:390 start_codon:yes stop_codon:yes gene_type:complete